MVHTTHQTSTYSPLTSNIFATVAPMLLSWREKNRCHVSSHEVTACFTSASFTSRLSDRCLMRCTKSWKLSGLWVGLSKISHPRAVSSPKSDYQHGIQNFATLGPPKKHVAGKRFPTEDDVKQAVSYCLQALHIRFVYVIVQALEPRRDKSLNVTVNCMEISCVSSAAELTYTGCNRRNGSDFGRVFLMLNYTDITQNTYIRSSMVTEI